MLAYHIDSWFPGKGKICQLWNFMHLDVTHIATGGKFEKYVIVYFDAPWHLFAPLVSVWINTGILI